jgi:RNA polymerase subunit RPABC4/transcription elongation factor Spt4
VHPDSSAGRSNAAVDTGASYGLKLLQGPGFVLSIPSEAIVERQTDSVGNPSWLVRAPAQLVTAGIGTADTTRFTDDRPLYSFTVSLGRKPASQTLEAWGDSVVAAHEATADELSTGEFGALQRVAGTIAYVRHPTCGDCGVDIVTFANRGQLVEIQYSTDTAEPLGVRKHGIYALILSTFRWTAPSPP